MWGRWVGAIGGWVMGEGVVGKRDGWWSRVGSCEGPCRGEAAMGWLSMPLVGAEISVSVIPTKTSKEFDVWRGCVITYIVVWDSGMRLVFFFFPLPEVEDVFSATDDTRVVGITTFALGRGGCSVCISTFGTGRVEVWGGARGLLSPTPLPKSTMYSL